jgi:hypothetical protein
MNKHLINIVLILGTILLVGCSANTAKVQIGLNSVTQQIMPISAGGSLPVESWLEIKSQQDLVETKAYFLKKAKESASTEEIQEWLDLAGQLSGSGSTLAKLFNSSSYRVTVIDGPFAGSTLEPGASTGEVRVPVGFFSFNVGWGHNQQSSIVRQVSAGQKMIVIVNK